MSALALPAAFWLYMRHDRARIARKHRLRTPRDAALRRLTILAQAVADRRGAAVIFRKY
jgi:hypothetical protein